MKHKREKEREREREKGRRNKIYNIYYFILL